MFVHGGGENVTAYPTGDYEFTLRVGKNFSNINSDYYDIKLIPKRGWDKDNEINVAMNDLSEMATLRRVAALTDTTLARAPSGRFAWCNDTTQHGDSLVIMGNPTLSSVGFLALGVKRLGKSAIFTPTEIWVDELRVSDIYKDPGQASDLSASVKLADLGSVTAGYSNRDADFHNVNTRIGGQTSDEAKRLGVSLALDKFLIGKWGFTLPVSFNYTENRGIPKYIPQTDTRIDPNNAPDSVKSVSKSYTYTASIRKAAGSKNPLVKFTVEGLQADLNYNKDQGRDFSVVDRHNETAGAGLTYTMPISKGGGLPFLWWNKKIPVLNLLGNPKFYFLPTKLTVGARGDNRDTYSATRTGSYDTNKKPILQVTESHLFSTTRQFSTGFAPLDPITIDYSRTHKGMLSSQNWMDLLKYDFGKTNNVTQTATANYSPQITSWFKPTFNYNAQYSWIWQNFSQPNGQSISNSGTAGMDLTLNFSQIFGPSGDRGERGGERSGERDARPGRSDSHDPGGREGANDQRPGAARPPVGRPGNLEGHGENPQERPGMANPQDHAEGPNKNGDPGKNDGPNRNAKSDSAKVDTSSHGKSGKTSMSPFKLMMSALTPIKAGLCALDPLSISIDQNSRHAQQGLVGQASIPYQLAFTQNPKLNLARNPEDSAAYISTPTRSSSLDITSRSGLRITNNIKTTFNHAYRVSESITTTPTGNTEQTMFWLGKKSSDLTSFPMVDVALDISGLEKISFLEKVAQSVAITSALTNKVKDSWSGNKSNKTSTDYTQQFNPLVGVNFSWKGNIDSQIHFNSSRSFSIANSGNKQRGSEQSATVTVSYSIRTGIKIPLIFMRPIRLDNQTTFSLNMDYTSSKQEHSDGGEEIYALSSAQSSWSISPRMSYTFSNTVTGQTYVKIQQTKNDVTNSKSRLFEFGVQVNISIRG
jgi:hypothetical protein